MFGGSKTASPLRENTPGQGPFEFPARPPEFRTVFWQAPGSRIRLPLRSRRRRLRRRSRIRDPGSAPNSDRNYGGQAGNCFRFASSASALDDQWPRGEELCNFSSEAFVCVNFRSLASYWPRPWSDFGVPLGAWRPRIRVVPRIRTGTPAAKPEIQTDPGRASPRPPGKARGPQTRAKT